MHRSASRLSLAQGSAGAAGLTKETEAFGDRTVLDTSTGMRPGQVGERLLHQAI
jgi:hypothetical protein